MATCFKSQIISLGRITIPKQVREELGLKEGDTVEVEGIKKMVLVPQKEGAS